MAVNLHFRQWFTGPVTAGSSVRYDEAAEALPLELAAEDNIEWLEKNDKVRIERAVRRSDAAPEYGFIRRVKAEAQYALVELETSGYFEWFHIDEVFLVLKASALTAAEAVISA